MRVLNNDELKNISFLSKNHVPYTLIEPTQTGLAKSILDATQEVRHFLASRGVHDYLAQGQGQEHKVQLPVYLHNQTETLVSTASLYRPNTKSGDPRIWFSGLAHIVNPNEIVAIIHANESLHLVSISQGNLETVPLSAGLQILFSSFERQQESAVKELTSLLREIASRGFIKTYKTGDTAVGHLLEEELGIAQNSSKAPDFKGIEIKSSRAKSRTRRTLFALVPDWADSKVKSSRELLDHYGYFRDGKDRLYCTLKSSAANSQGLYLNYDFANNFLEEWSLDSNHSPAVKWAGPRLRNALEQKHKETFWVSAESMKKDGHEYIRFIDVLHTKDPVSEALPTLIMTDHITVDHLISRRNNSVVEKGPLFKTDDVGHGILFPEPNYISLINQ